MSTKTNLLIAASMAGLIGCATTEDAEKSAEADIAAAPVPAVAEVFAMGVRSSGLSRQITPVIQPPVVERSRFDNGDANPVQRVIETPVSTFSADVDTASYSAIRRFLSDNAMPPSEAVRVEELINYFSYSYEPATADDPFAPTVWVTPTPWNADTELLHIGIKGFDIVPEETPNANIVLLIDVSGSMNQPNKLPLLRQSMEVLVDQLGPDDRISMVTYAGATRVALEPTPGDQRVTILAALDQLTAGGSTAGAAGLSLAYELAEQNFDEDAVNRIIVATDGDFNVGVTGDEGLEDLVTRQRDSGIYLSVLGFGMYNLNDQMMQVIAQTGNGIAAYIDTLQEAERVLGREFRANVFPIAEDLKFQVEFNPAAVSEYRLIGYQTRLLAREDFNNDNVDAGDIGSGHTVTALYEIRSAGSETLIEPLRYGEEIPAADPDAELAFLRIRYKEPGEDESQLITRVITSDDRIDDLDRAPADARFAAAVAGFGERLSRTGYADGFEWDEIIDLGLNSRGDDPYGDRIGFVNLVRSVQRIDEGQ